VESQPSSVKFLELDRRFFELYTNLASSARTREASASASAPPYLERTPKTLLRSTIAPRSLGRERVARSVLLLNQRPGAEKKWGCGSFTTVAAGSIK